jgi:hypothetical protein
VDRNADVAAAAAAAASDGAYEDDDGVDNVVVKSTKLDKERSIKHKRSDSEGDATASACSTSPDNFGEGSNTEHQDSAAWDEHTCASSNAVAVQI